MVTHQEGPNLPLKSKQELRFSVKRLYWNATFALMSTGGLVLPDVSPCTAGYNCINRLSSPLEICDPFVTKYWPKLRFNCTCVILSEKLWILVTITDINCTKLEHPPPQALYVYVSPHHTYSKDITITLFLPFPSPSLNSCWNKLKLSQNTLLVDKRLCAREMVCHVLSWRIINNVFLI